jgi:hypothetical protein
MAHQVPANWRSRIEALLADEIGALGSLIFGDVLASTGFVDREPNLHQALHVFEVLKKELPSQLQDGELAREILRVMFGEHGAMK